MARYLLLVRALFLASRIVPAGCVVLILVVVVSFWLSCKPGLAAVRFATEYSELRGESVASASCFIVPPSSEALAKSRREDGIY